MKEYLKSRNFIRFFVMVLVGLAAFIYANQCTKQGAAGLDAFRKAFFVVSLLVCALGIAAYWLLMIKRVKLEYVFLLTVFVLGTTMSLMVPVRSAPDESLRIDSVLAVAGKMTGMDTGKRDELTLRVIEDEDGLSATGIDHAYYASWFSRLTERESSPETKVRAFSYTTEVPQVIYAVPAVGAAIGRALHLGTVPTLMLARFMNLLVFLAAGFYAIRRTPYGKELFFLISMLPMMLQEVSTLSIDSIPLSLCFILIAGTLHYAAEQKTLKELFSENRVKTVLELVLLLVSAFLLSGCKYGGLIPVVLLLLIPVLEKWKKDRILSLGALGVLLFCLLAGFLPQLYSTFHSDILVGAGTHYTVSDIFSDPMHSFTVFGNTINRYLDHYFYSTIGTSLGWFELNIPVHLAFCYLLLILSLILTQKKVALKPWSKRIIVLLFVFGVLFAFAGMMLGNTDKTSAVIEGVQGRYFLPFLLPLLLFAGEGRLLPSDGKEFSMRILSLAHLLSFIVVMYLFARAY